MTRHALILTVLLLFGALPAAAVDLNRLGTTDRRYYCFAYIQLDAALKQSQGEITSQQFEQTLTRVAMLLMNRGTNQDYRADFARLDRARDAILAEDPTVGEVLSNAAACRQYLRF